MKYLITLILITSIAMSSRCTNNVERILRVFDGHDNTYYDIMSKGMWAKEELALVKCKSHNDRIFRNSAIFVIEWTMEEVSVDNHYDKRPIPEPFALKSTRTIICEDGECKVVFIYTS